MLSKGAAPPINRRQALAGAAAACFASLARPVAAREPVWLDQRRLGPFVCRSTFPLGDRLIVETDLAQLQQGLQASLGVRECREEIEVLLLSNSAQHKQFLAERHPAAPYRRALFYKQQGRGVVYAYLHKDLPVDLRHECTHALLHADLPMVPLWLDEGIAEYFEPRPQSHGDAASRLRKVRRDLTLGRLRTLTYLERKHELSQLGEMDYRFSWAWAHFLLHGPPEVRAELQSYLASLRRMQPPGLMSQRLAAAIPNYQRQFANHFWRWQGLRQASESSDVKV